MSSHHPPPDRFVALGMLQHEGLHHERVSSGQELVEKSQGTLLHSGVLVVEQGADRTHYTLFRQEFEYLWSVGGVTGFLGNLLEIMEV